MAQSTRAVTKEIPTLMTLQQLSSRSSLGLGVTLFRYQWVFLLLTAASLLIPPLQAQSSAFPVGLPFRAPGYEHYYHTEQLSSAFATRWGYFDGYRDGKHDRELGKTTNPMDHDRFKLVPDHGTHPDIPRAQYKTIYREAYLHGYEYGSKS